MRKKKQTNKQTRSEKRPFTSEKGKNLEKTSEKRKNLERKKKKNQIREEALYIREGEEPKEKKIKNRKREKNETRVGGFEVSAWDHGWVDWL